ncbi:RNA-binding protein [Candidatus Woesearchaeota archaeon]|nr:RNA-binding protein [Candidatus Woesearchaeota archaeon]
MKMHNLSKKDIKELNMHIEDNFGKADFFDKKGLIKKYQDKQNGVTNVFYAKEDILFIQSGDIFFPSLKNILKNNFLPKFIVDMKAISFVTNGADIMRPGITDFPNGIEKGDIVSVCDETHQKPLCIGMAMFSGDEIKSMDKGKVIRNIHYVSDDFWNLKI